MAHETIHGAYRQTNLQNESADYLSKREELRIAEIDLMRQVFLAGRQDDGSEVDSLKTKRPEIAAELIELRSVIEE